MITLRLGDILSDTIDLNDRSDFFRIYVIRDGGTSPSSARVGALFDEGSFLVPSNLDIALSVSSSIRPSCANASTSMDVAGIARTGCVASWPDCGARDVAAGVRALSLVNVPPGARREVWARDKGGWQIVTVKP